MLECIHNIRFSGRPEVLSVKKKKIKRIIPLLLTVCALAAFFLLREQPAQDGWTVVDGQTFYYTEDQPLTHWQYLDGDRYYFGDDGALRTGWQELGGNRYYFDASGRMVTGWYADAHYFYPDGTLATGWLELDGHHYFLGQDGRVKKGVVEMEDGTKYLLSEQGYVTSGWTTVLGQLYYADSEGHPLFGWQEIAGKKHFFEESGAAASGWRQMNGFTYYFYTDGAPAQGKLDIDGQTHYFASDGQQLLLVNPWHTVPEDYTVDLVPISDAHKVASTAFEDYMDMIADCEAAGHKPVVCSSYRTQEYQEMLFQNRVNSYLQTGHPEEEAIELAGRSVAVPGTSEHQLGLALDIVDEENTKLDESQATMPTQQWLMANSWRYGWILRYPSEKSAYTGIIFEPWHYRYVGRTVAKEIHAMGVCLEEYFEILTNSVG